MHPIRSLKRRLKTMKRIEELQRITLKEFLKVHDPDPYINMSIYADITSDQQNELDHLLEAPLRESAKRWGIDIPDRYWINNKGARWLNLSDDGRNWIRRELSKKRREWAKDWVAIISPVLSAIIAILGLLVALRNADLFTVRCPAVHGHPRFF